MLNTSNVEAAYQSIVANLVHPRMTQSTRMMHRVTKLRSPLKTGFLPVIWTRLQTEQEIHIMDVQITNLCDAFMSIRTDECFLLIVKSVPQRTEAALKANRRRS